MIQALNSDLTKAKAEIRSRGYENISEKESGSSSKPSQFEQQQQRPFENTAKVASEKRNPAVQDDRSKNFNSIYKMKGNEINTATSQSTAQANARQMLGRFHSPQNFEANRIQGKTLGEESPTKFFAARSQISQREKINQDLSQRSPGNYRKEETASSRILNSSNLNRMQVNEPPFFNFQ